MPSIGTGCTLISIETQAVVFECLNAKQPDSSHLFPSPNLITALPLPMVYWDQMKSLHALSTTWGSSLRKSLTLLVFMSRYVSIFFDRRLLYLMITGCRQSYSEGLKGQRAADHSINIESQLSILLEVNNRNIPLSFSAIIWELDQVHLRSTTPSWPGSSKSHPSSTILLQITRVHNGTIYVPNTTS